MVTKTFRKIRHCTEHAREESERYYEGDPVWTEIMCVDEEGEFHKIEFGYSKERWTCLHNKQYCVLVADQYKDIIIEEK